LIEKKTESTRRRVRVRLRVGENPRTWDVDTEQELTDRIAEIRILPFGKAVATVYELDREGKNIVLNGEVACIEADVVRIEGIWEARQTS
jgi:hypothetical protein